MRFPGEDIENAVLVEETAIGTDLGGRYVMVVGDGDVVERRYIEPGPLQEDKTRVVLEGLEAGERYIVKGLQRARPGMPVTSRAGVNGAERGAERMFSRFFIYRPDLRVGDLDRHRAGRGLCRSRCCRWRACPTLRRRRSR